MGLVAIIGAANFSWQLGSSSLFIDEALSWDVADGGVRDVLSGVRATEISPPAHYYGLWAWIGAFGAAEWVMRLPSAVAGVCLVLVVFRLGSLVFGPRAGLLSALLMALSPLVLTFAQQARAYVFAMLLATAAVLALLEARRADARRRRRIWLVIGAAAAVLGFWTHYTAGLVLAPLLVWVCFQRAFRRGVKIALAGAVLLSWVAALPLLTEQLSHGHQLGIAAGATLTVEHVVGAVGTPFDGRAGRTAWLTAGAAVVALAAAAAIGLRRMRRTPGATLIVAAAVAPILAVIGVTAASDDVLLTRYTTVAAPFMLVLIGGSAARAPRPLGIVLGCAALACAVATTVLNHATNSFYPDVRLAYKEIAASYRPGDAIAVSGYPSIGPVSEYYKGQQVPEAPSALLPNMGPELSEVIRQRRRVWTLSSSVSDLPGLRRGLAPLGYRLERATTLQANGDLQLVLAAPR